eukprot:TRINITY_DN8356_c0_g1_i1.p2 TRINITY_DN8356_c0_g1~~TRINITY_DN8356_c0_g1_i1.p2  ORF type:complete len:406 (+),score=139.48 TRINITY_DN8356_c0_g1_i1:66-1220(+)
MTGAVVQDAGGDAPRDYHVQQGVIDPEVCDALLRHSHQECAAARERGDDTLFGKIRAPENRYDVLLDMTGPVPLALSQLVERLRSQLTDVVGDDATLVELAAITSQPGAASQPVHADTVHGIVRFLNADISGMTQMLGLEEGDDGSDGDDDCAEVLRTVATDTAPLWTCLTALQDVEPDMGPTLVWPGTNTVECHSDLYGYYQQQGAGQLTPAAADDLFRVRHQPMLLRKGDSVCYDSRLMHCGGANTSADRPRTVLVTTFMGTGVPPEGSTYDLRRHLRGKFRVRNFPLEFAADQPLDVPSVPIPPPAAAANAPLAEGAGREVPALETWEAAVQCVRCKQWRPCSGSDAAMLTLSQWRCADSRFSCFTPQGYSVAEIDRWLES